ncbi:tetratricopeptide repeat protein [Desulfovibrio sp. ZJ369]|uniref:tetratricopeptide repeat protein n=1 Tax=Desulfovibrio sp. ZJ369 TaxID=2709793 RepID=UPI0013EB855D|nr:tetratricopeptide repeat protein [Desulfovibrio sp. ZJ369]
MKKLALFIIAALLCLPATAHTSDDANFKHARELIEQNKIDEAKSILLPLTVDFTLTQEIRATAYFYLSYCESAEKAISYVQQAIALGRSGSNVYFRLAQLQYKQGMIDAAILSLDKAISEQRGQTSRDTYKYHRLMAECNAINKDWKRAQREADAAIYHNRNDIESYYLRGIAYYNVNDNESANFDEKALSDLKVYIRNCNDDNKKMECYIYIGKIHNKHERISEAIDAFERAARLAKNERLRNKLIWRIKSLRHANEWNS